MLRFLIAFALVCAPCFAAVVTTDSTDLTAVRAISSTTTDGQAEGTITHSKAVYLKFAMPGGWTTINSVVLYVYTNSFVDEAPAGSLPITLTADGDETWDNTSNAATLSGLALDAAGTSSITTTGWKAITLTGGISTADSTLTVKIDSGYGTETTAGSGGLLGTFCFEFGGDCDPAYAGLLATLEVDPSEANYPYLLITYDEGGEGEGEGEGESEGDLLMVFE